MLDPSVHSVSWMISPSFVSPFTVGFSPIRNLPAVDARVCNKTISKANRSESKAIISRVRMTAVTEHRSGSGSGSGSDVKGSNTEANYVSPLSTRYASSAMRAIFADVSRARLWRKLWATLARAEHELGLEVTLEQVEALEDAPDVDMSLALKHEREVRHDVMAHVRAFGEQVPIARGIIHLGATSCFVTDNADVLAMHDALNVIIPAVWGVVRNLGQFAREHSSVATLAFTHLQPAQPTTVGKRACLWLQDFLFDAYTLERARDELRLRGVKGTTGTQASFLSLFDGDHEKVRQLERRVVSILGFEGRTWAVTGQTYPRKQDFAVMAALAGIGQSAAKMANDIRLLQFMKEVEEPFEKSQIGSSAMPYKRNPMRSERICALARFLQTLMLNPAETASTQWLERTLDDSANRRLAMSEAFLTADAILQLSLNVSSNLVVYPDVVRKHLLAELPFMATENVLMSAVKAGGDRQTLHEALRVHAMAAGKRVKESGAENDLLDRIRDDPLFKQVKHSLDDIMTNPDNFVGRAPQQVIDFLNEEVEPALSSRKQLIDKAGKGDVRV